MSTKRFEEFWKLYPNRVNKKKAKELWEKQGCDAVAETILGHLTTRVKTDEKWLKGFIIGPEVFIRGERWQDEYQEAKSKFKGYSPDTTVVDESIPSPGLLGTARYYNVATQDESGKQFTAEQITKLFYAKKAQNEGRLDSQHLLQLPESSRCHLIGIRPPF